MWTALKTLVGGKFYTNGNNEITGQMAYDAIDAVIDALGTYEFVGRAEPSDTPASGERLLYVASTVGTYTSFSNITIAAGEMAFLKLNGTTWQKILIGTTSSGGGASSSITLDAAFVSTANGDDSTAMYGSLSNMYATIDAAVSDMEEGHTLYVLDGNHTVGSSASHLFNVECRPNTTITFNATLFPNSLTYTGNIKWVFDKVIGTQSIGSAIASKCMVTGRTTIEIKDAESFTFQMFKVITLRGVLKLERSNNSRIGVFVTTDGTNTVSGNTDAYYYINRMYTGNTTGLAVDTSEVTGSIVVKVEYATGTNGKPVVGIIDGTNICRLHIQCNATCSGACVQLDTTSGYGNKSIEIMGNIKSSGVPLQLTGDAITGVILTQSVLITGSTPISAGSPSEVVATGCLTNTFDTDSDVMVLGAGMITEPSL